MFFLTSLRDACLPAFRFLYSDEVQIGPETVMTTLYTAKKYAVPALEAHCVEFLKKNLRADNAFMLLTQVRLPLLARIHWNRRTSFVSVIIPKSCSVSVCCAVFLTGARW